MFGAILKATNSSFQKGMTFYRSIYVKKVMKLLAFIFEQPSYNLVKNKEVVWTAQTCGHFMKILTVYTLNSHLLTLKAHDHKCIFLCCPLKYLKPHRQTVWTQIRLLL